MFLSQQYKEMTGEKLTSGLKRRLGGLFKFEQYWEVCTEVTKAEFGFVSARFTRDCFKKMCATELEVLEENDRQCNFRTPSRPLVSDARCSVYPPDFRSVTSANQQMLKPKLKFGCTKLPPQLYPTRVYELNEKMGVFSCLFCGDLVNAGKGVTCNLACNQNRVVHTWCCKKAGISNHNFSCDKINEHFIPDKLGEKRARFRDPLSNCVDPARFFCLICGDRVAEWEPEFRGKRSFHHGDLICCKFKDDDRSCEFSAHLECATIHSKFLLGQKEFLLADFCCDSVKYAIPRETIKHLARPRIRGRLEKIKMLKITGRIKQSSDKRKRRYMNPNNFCKHCCEEIPRHQKNHLLQHCTAINCSPAVRGKYIDLRATARRCLAISCAESNSAGMKMPTRRQKRRFGEGDGESIAETTPKRKKRSRIAQLRNTIRYPGQGGVD